MENKQYDMKKAMKAFCLRVLGGEGSPQEVAILPEVLKELRIQSFWDT